jgi:cell wall-associated NlpC family hydrolase
MRKEPMHQVKQYIRQKRRHRVWNRVVAGLAAVVVFSTTYMLIIPAITMEQTAYCGIEAHTHEEACFEKQLVCAVEESAPHIHSESCYQEEQVLICGQNEKPGHVHDESCIQRELVPVCTEDHAHSDACYQTVETYICGLAEGEGAHRHGAACYETESVPACGQEENAEGHVHTEACYEAMLICPKEEHEHTLGCFSNPEADVETPAVWENTVSNVKLTGVWADDVVAIAESQLGYEESARNYVVTEEGQKKGYTRYGAWYGDPYGDWCAMFVSFCLHYAGVEGYPLDANCQNWIETLSRDPYQSYFAAENYDPQPGDLIFFNTDDKEDADHTGIVTENIEGTDAAPALVKTIEGNSSNRVQYVTYEKNDPQIMGYGRLPENPNRIGLEQQFSFAVTTAEGQILTLSGPLASLPYPADEITITAEKVVSETATALVDAAVADTDLENGYVYLFDVRLWHNGEEIEPIGPVSLAISGVAATEEDQSAKVFHVDEESGQATDMNAEVQEDGEIVFDTDHFSLYSIVLSTPLLGPSNANNFNIEVSTVPAPNYVGSIPDSSISTEWQITKEPYSGNSQLDKIPFDGDNDGVPDVYLQKNVVPTDVENEFLIYLSMDKKMTWEQFFHESAVLITTSNRYAKDQVGTIYPSVDAGKKSELMPHNQEGTYKNKYYINFNVYQNQSSTTPLYSYYDWRYGDTPECSKGTVFLNAPGLGYLVAGRSVNYHYTTGGTGNPFKLDIYLDELNADFAMYNTEFDSVVDKLGDYMEYVELVNSDGSVTYDETTRTLTWTPDDNESVISSINAGPPVNGWENNISQLVYRVRLNVQKEFFISCADTLSSPEASVQMGESYPTNSFATLNYHKEPLEGAVGTASGALTASYPVPEVRGLLYNITFSKENEYGRNLPGAVFGIYKEDGETPVTDSDGKPYTITTSDTEISRFQDLPWGTYVIKELSPPAHYSAPADSKWTVTVCYTSDRMSILVQDSDDLHNLRYAGNDNSDGKWIILNSRNEYVYQVRVLKTDESGNVLQGVRFSITDPGDMTATLEEQTDASGRISFSGTFHPNIEYTLSELDTPDGYNILPANIHFRLLDDTTTDQQKVELVNDTQLNGLVDLYLNEESGVPILLIKVINQTGYVLPETGGPGTTLFTLSGLCLIVSALMYTHHARRRRERRIRN